MIVTYLHHSGFFVELDRTCLLFDYTGGKLPVEHANKTLAVFASHAHGDHFSPKIFALAQQWPNIWFFLSDDIQQGEIPKEFLPKTVFLKPGQDIAILDMQIKTLSSTDEGVAFFVTAEGKTLYHAGDLHNWYWNGEPEQNNRAIEGAYLKELHKIEGACPDAAFVVLDPRQEEQFYLGLHQFMDIVGASAVFPMHFWGKFEICQRLKSLPRASEYQEKVKEIHQKGQQWEI